MDMSGRLILHEKHCATATCTGLLQNNITSQFATDTESICYSCQSTSTSLAELPVFPHRWPWRPGKTNLRSASRKLSRGQQDVPWLRRRGSKNSRKLLYFVEWAQECKMSALGFFFLGLARITCWRRRALKLTVCMCVCLRCRSGCSQSPTSTFSSVSLWWGSSIDAASLPVRLQLHLQADTLDIWFPPDGDVCVEKPVTCVRKTI